MKNLNTLLILLFFLFMNQVAISQQSGWVLQQHVTDEILRSVFFVSPDVGWAAGGDYSGIILNTTNGGTNWTIQLTSPNYRFDEIFFMNANTGWAVGPSKILKTTNGGINWIGLNTPMMSNNSVRFLNENTGYVAGSAVLKTTNGGINWTSSLSVNLRRIRFYSLTSGCTVGEGGKVFTTVNSGINWLDRSITSSVDVILGLTFPTDFTGWLCGTNGNIYKTTNGGNNWTSQTSNTNSALRSIYFINNSTGWCLAPYGLILNTTNGGSFWQSQFTNSERHFYDIYFLNSTTGYVVGDSGVIMKTTNGGIITSLISNEMKIDDYKINVYPNPANPNSVVEFYLPKNEYIKLEIFDISGRFIKRVFENKLLQGTHKIIINNHDFKSGVYFCKINGATFSKTAKLVFLK